MKVKPSKQRLDSDSEPETAVDDPSGHPVETDEIPEHLLASPTSKKLAELGDADEDSDQEIVLHRGTQRPSNRGDIDQEGTTVQRSNVPRNSEGQQAATSNQRSFQNVTRGHASSSSENEGQSDSDIGEEQIIGRRNDAPPGVDEVNEGQVNEEIFADDGPVDMNAAAEELLAMEQADDGKAGKKKRVIKKRRVLNAKSLLDKERGLISLNKSCRKIKFKGKGHEKDDLERLLWTMEHWAHRISPNLKFEDFLEQAEKLSRKQEITSFLRSVRAGDKDDELEIGNKNENNENDADANFEELMGLDSNALREEENLIREMSTFQEERFGGNDNHSGTPGTPQNVLNNRGTPQSVASNLTVSSGFNVSSLVTSTPFPGAQQVKGVQATANESPKLSQEMKDLIEQKKQMALARRRERMSKQLEKQTEDTSSEITAIDS